MGSSSRLLRSLEGVCDERSFLHFLETLGADRAEAVRMESENPSSPYGPEANGWENPTVESFLLAAVSWAADSHGAPALAISENPWRRCADILYAGKGYE